MVFTNASRALPPWGGAAAFFGTSPFAFGAPTGGGAPFLIDMAMSVVARGKLKFAAQRGEPIAPGLALDKQGRQTTDGQAAFEGVVLPFGGVKGAALSWMMDVLGGVFTGAAFGGDVGNPFTDLGQAQGTGHVMLAIRADLFMSMETFEARIQSLAERAKAQPRSQGVDEILSPGEPESRQHTRNIRHGIPLTPDVVAAIKHVGTRMSVVWPFE
jgi:LDH2 family malate/lactate/ureidoglycolate dehydrogenase